MNQVPIPASVASNPRLDRWLRFEADRTVRLAVGKVELGQGILTALAQIAAEELDVAMSRVRIVSGDTDDAPDEGSTSSSLSIEISGASVRLVSAEARTRIIDRLAQRLNCSPHDIAVEDGTFLRNGAPTGHDYWNFASGADLAREAEGNARPKSYAAYRVVGGDARRVDLAAKLTGAAFIHDMSLPGMLHARVLRQPARGSVLASLDEIALRRAARGDLTIMRLGNFVALVSQDETAVQRTAIAAPAHMRWENVREIQAGADEAASLIGAASSDRVLGAPNARESGEIVEATYSRAYLAHASIAPSCALAEERDGHLMVWSHTQAVYPLRASLARVLDRDPQTITVKHVQGAGCYGHNGADDVALDAALIARQFPGRAIRVQWRREEEFGFEPLSTAQVVTLRTVLGEHGRPTGWTAEIWAGSHVQRPAMGGNMLAHEALPNPAPEPRPADPPEANGGGGTRNATPLYDIANKRIIHHLVQQTPVRTSALRSLGAHANVFALECFTDELALRAREDPVAYRLSVLSDQRARRVIETAAARAGWNQRGPAGTGRGMGIGFAQYKNRSAYAAVVVEVEVDREVRLLHAWCAADAGLVINPDGVRNQLEGGIVQAASFTLKEQVRFDRHGVASLDWDSYPILRFSEVPEITVDLIDAPHERPLGMGECTIGPTAAAIGNAVAHALGARVRDLPLTRERIEAALLA